MLYILPPPRTPNPPSPWDSILCSGGGNNNNGSASERQWDKNRKPPPRLRLRTLPFKHDDGSTGPQDDNMDTNRNPKSLSECYFAGKGTALALPAAAEAQKSSRRSDAQGSNIRKHLQAIVDLLRPEETLKMAVKLESAHPARIRYLVIISKMGSRGGEESCLLGIDCNEQTTIGLVLKVMADTDIRLDGDGGFSLSVCNRHHIFKPVSVQAMWSALQTLHKVSSKAREQNYFQGGLSHDWVNYYEERIKSDRSCLNEWHAMDNLESKRPPSPDSIRTKPRQREETEKVIRTTLKEIMMSVDLDEVTSKYIRTRLEEHLDMDLGEYKSFIDQEMLTILGQMDAPTEIFDHVYLGSEWNASNYEELHRNGVGHILNVTREIDNFFPGTFDYLNVRVYDDEKTDLLKHWDDTYKYINKAKMSGSKVLVHCKMGVSRSASVVIAYAMKAYNWDFKTAMEHVKEKRTCIKPNTSFLSQLETYQGILDAMKNKDKLQRSKSETNLKLPNNNGNNSNSNNNINNKCKVLAGSEPTPVIQALSKHNHLQTTLSGQDLRNLGTRPKSWSPDNVATTETSQVDGKSPISYSLEDLSQKSASKESVKTMDKQARHVLMPCDNGESYSVSPNQIVHLPGKVKDRINELESNNRVNFDDTTAAAEKQQTFAAKEDTWDPGERQPINQIVNNSDCDSPSPSVVVYDNETVWTSSTVVKNISKGMKQVPDDCSNNNGGSGGVAVTIRKESDPFSNQLDRVFDREEEKKRDCPSRQSSWSSYDSAVVMGGGQNNGLSRHSSWGSGDTRVLPSRNSSWGSYDMRPRGPVHYVNEKGERCLQSGELIESSSSGIFPYDKEDIPWHPGTVRRTKQKIEAGKKSSNESSSSNETLYEYADPAKPVEAVNSELINRMNTPASAITPNIEIVGKSAPVSARLSVSAPESTSSIYQFLSPVLSRSTQNVSAPNGSVVSTAQCSSVKKHRQLLENFNGQGIKGNKSQENVAPFSGLVKNLKKEFEAKTSTEVEGEAKRSKGSGNSAPASPTCPHQDKTAPAAVKDDSNIKGLVGMFENNKLDSQQVNKRSAVEVVKAKLPIDYSTPYILKSSERPPVVRNTSPNRVRVATTVIATAVTKKQQQYGKSHPLAKLAFKKHNNTVYNTM